MTTPKFWSYDTSVDRVIFIHFPNNVDQSLQIWPRGSARLVSSSPHPTPLPGNLLAGATFNQELSNGSGMNSLQLETLHRHDNLATAFDMDSFQGSEPLFASYCQPEHTMRIDGYGGYLNQWELKHFAVIFGDSGSDHVEAINPSDCTGSGSVLSITVSEVACSRRFNSLILTHSSGRCRGSKGLQHGKCQIVC